MKVSRASEKHRLTTHSTEAEMACRSSFKIEGLIQFFPANLDIGGAVCGACLCGLDF